MVPKCFLLLLVFSFSNGVLCCKSTPPAIDCEVSHWHQWTGCTPSTCLRGEHTYTCIRYRVIDTPSSNGGHPCPARYDEGHIPCPVNCRLDLWSKWSDCTTCGTGGRSRYRAVDQPAVFNGNPCTSALEEIDVRCVANDTCDTDTCNSNEFTCGNGNSIDETCSSDEPIPGILIAGRGVDILRKKFERRILDNTKYGDTCVIIRSNKVDLRKPLNIDEYDDQVASSEDSHMEGYSSAQEYRHALMTKFRDSFSFLGEFTEVSAAVSLSNDEEMSRLIESSASKSSSFYHLEIKIGIASFETKTRDLVLSRRFVDDIKQLPKHYDFAKYSKLFIDYGTHYISSGTFGGKFKYVLQYSNEKLSTLNKDTLKHCLQVGILASFISAGKAGNANASHQNCDETFTQKYGSVLSFASHHHKIAVGGNPATRGVLTEPGAQPPSREDYAAWTKSVSESPDIISFKLAPVTELLPNDKQEYGRQALKFYLKLYDPANCKVSCQNNGKLTVLNGGKECHCVCPFPYYGIGCEKELKNI